MAPGGLSQGTRSDTVAGRTTTLAWPSVRVQLYGSECCQIGPRLPPSLAICIGRSISCPSEGSRTRRATPTTRRTTSGGSTTRSFAKVSVADYVRGYLHKPASDGFKKLEDADSLDLACEAFVVDESKAYAHLFTDEERRIARQRLGPHVASIEKRRAESKARVESRRRTLPEALDDLRELADLETTPEDAIAVNAEILRRATDDVVRHDSSRPRPRSTRPTRPSGGALPKRAGCAASEPGRGPPAARCHARARATEPGALNDCCFGLGLRLRGGASGAQRPRRPRSAQSRSAAAASNARISRSSATSGARKRARARTSLTCLSRPRMSSTSSPAMSSSG